MAPWCCGSTGRVVSPAAAVRPHVGDKALPMLLGGKAQVPEEKLDFTKRIEVASTASPHVVRLIDEHSPSAQVPTAEGGESTGTPSTSLATGDSTHVLLPNQPGLGMRRASRHNAHSGLSLDEQLGTACTAPADEQLETAAPGGASLTAPPTGTVTSAKLFTSSPAEVPSIGGCVDIQTQHSQHLLPAEVALFEPSQEEIFFEGLTTGGHRQIFLNTPLTDEEQQALSKLHEALDNEADKQGYAAGRFPNFMRLHALRMLQQSRYDVQRTISLMQTHLAERVARLPISEADVMEDLRSGFMYWHGRDRKCRPCLVIRLERLGKMVTDSDRAVRLVLFVLEYAIRFALVPGRVENWVVIMDLTNSTSLISPMHVPSIACTAVHLGVALEKVYAGRMVWMKIVNMPGSGMLRRIVDGAIPADKKKKVSFPSESELPQEMAAEFELNQLERRYGGTAPDLEADETYPFRFFADCRGQGSEAPVGDAEAAGLTAGGSLHPLSTRALHEGCLWDESRPEAREAWLRQARTSSLAPQAAEAASALLAQQGKPPVVPCRRLSEWLELNDLSELSQPSAGQFASAPLTRTDTQKSARWRWL